MIRRFLTGVLLVVLTAFSGYNWLQVRLLQAQVQALQARSAKQDRQAQTMPDWISKAGAHAEAARLALTRTDWKTAQRELEEGIADLQKASQTPEAKQSEMSLQVQIKQFQRQADALWQRAAAQSDHRLK